MKIFAQFLELSENCQTIILLISFVALFTGSVLLGMYSSTAQNLTFRQTPHIVSQATTKTFTIIFTNNILCAFLILIGFLSFGITTFFVITYNGIVVGYTLSIGINHIGLLKTLMLIVPHGIIEITAILLLAAISIQLSIAFVQLLFSNLTDKRFFSIFCSTQVLFLLVLVFIAALIETFVTPYIFEYTAKIL